jgi:ribonuclease HI
MSANNMIAYTDGSFRKELKIGGWSAVLIKGNKIFEFCQCGFATDNCIMELKAIILAIENTPINSNVTIYSDARSLIDAIQSQLLINKTELPLKNKPLWQYLTEITKERNVSFVWIKGHYGIEGNVRAHELAYQALLELKNSQCNKGIKELFAVKIPTKYKEKKFLLIRFLLIRFNETIKMAERIKFDRNTILKLQEKKKGLENSVIKQEYLISKSKPEFKQNAELLKKKKLKCFYCDKLFKKESYRDQHIRDNIKMDTLIISYVYCGIKFVVEQL